MQIYICTYLHTYIFTYMYTDTGLCFTGGDALVNELDVFRNTPLHYLCQRYTEQKNTSRELELRQCIGRRIHLHIG